MFFLILHLAGAPNPLAIAGYDKALCESEGARIEKANKGAHYICLQQPSPPAPAAPAAK